MALMRRAVERVGAAVGADHPLRVRQDAFEILFAHGEADHPDLSLATLEQRDGERVGLELLSLCETPEPLAVSGGDGEVGDAGDLNVVPCAAELDLRDGLVSDLLRWRGIAEPLEELFRRAGARPDGKEVAQACLIRDVRIAIERDVDAACFLALRSCGRFRPSRARPGRGGSLLPRCRFLCGGNW